MEHPIVVKIMKEGINSVNISMLDKEAQKRILSDAGEKLCKENRFKEAIEAMTRAGEIEKLLGLGDEFMKQGRSELAALCIIPTKDKQKLNSVAVLCIQSRNYSLAAAAYDASENRQMADFIRKNFC